jgi:Tol biopolymer transport system component/DNA-binding winged helix-turn-helix (wHTH) protein
MDEVVGSPQIVRFGIFEANLQSAELYKNGTKVPLQGQPFQVCVILLEHPGELVTREELRRRVWPEDTFVDFDHALNTAITKIRLALGDQADNPRFVETLPRRGYRFIASVDKPRSQGAAPLVPKNRTLVFTAKAQWLAAGAALLVLLSGIEIWLLHRSRSNVRLPAIEVVPLAGLSGFESEAAFSPDGNLVAFALHSSKDPGIYATAVGGEKSVRLTSDPRDCCPRWSPDGRQVAFSRAAQEGFDFYVVPALGGTEHRLSSWPPQGSQISTVSQWRSVVRCFDWSPDGKVLAFSNNQADKTHAWITLLSLADSTIRPLTSPPSQSLDYGPAFSPDGSTVAFIRGTAAGVVEDLYVVPTNGGVPRRLTFDNSWINAPPTWTPDGRDIVFSSLRGGAPTLWRISASGGTPRPLPGVGVNASIPSISRKGNMLIYQQVSPDKINIRRLNLRDLKHPQGPPAILVAEKGGSSRPHFSPDGRRIVFESDRSGYSEIWTCESDGTNCGQLTSLRGIAGAARWSPDGRYIAFEFRPKEHSEIYLVETGVGVPRLLPTLPGADNGGPNWSKDGKWIYFYSDRGGGPFQLWKIQVSGGSPLPVTKNGGVFSAESADGRFLYYSKYETPGIWKMPLNGGEEIRVLDQPAGDNWWNWALTSDGIYLFDESVSRSRTVLQWFDFATAKKTSLTTADKPCLGLAVSADGRSIVYANIEPQSAQSSIMLVKNFD